MLSRKFIREAQSSEEIAGVLAHEIGHHAHRHPLATSFRETFLFISGIATLSLTASSSAFGLLAAALLGLEITIHRRAEREADGAAVEMLNHANIRSDALVEMFQRQAAMEHSYSAFERWLSKEPSSESRAQVIATRARGLGDAMTPEEWTAIKRICD